MEHNTSTLTPTKTADELFPPCSAATLSLKRALQTHLKSLMSVLSSLESAEKDGEQHIVALANLLEQRECVDKVEEINMEMIATFPDLKSRLTLKISTQVDKEIEHLMNSLVPLRGMKQAMHQARADILSMASSQSAKDINQAAMYEGTPTIPPLAVMIDFIQAVEKEARELYCSRVYYLENLSERSSVASHRLHDLWMEDSTKMTRAIKDFRALVKYFLEEKL